ncbi:oligouridylate-binding 1-like [Micractinium conductrix]|uniref:Oligouridylate-binding 1-like n=1 Tax=Micractinium conductrix TaxID=554055 RepID=A0A2P6VMW4_9CHLO|nr:oligouridylate-binding 1-like [Micractinium conductrix]|eukprot:PSC75397.1 oligouridylate-binding 1-like [Micractinium conductrix]
MTQANPAQPEAARGGEPAPAVPAMLHAAGAQQTQEPAGPTAAAVQALPQQQPLNGGAKQQLVALPQQGPGGLPLTSVSVASVLALGGNPGTGLIAVSSTASLASSAAGGHEGNKTLYLGNLHPFVTEATLQDVFAGLGGITELKVIKDKATGVSAGYGFAKFTDSTSAQLALDKVNKNVLFGQEVRVNWAFQKEQKEEVANHFHVFVGDLSSDVTDAMLHAAFAGCPGCSDARVMWDHATGRSRGFGFVSFRMRQEADAAIQTMHGQFIGARRVRCGWAQHKTEGIAAMDPQILDRADPTNTNVYVGNLAPALSDAEVRRHFGAFGPIAEVKLYRKGSYGFVRYKNHQDAVRAIGGMNGQNLGGKVMKCSWGRHPSTPPSGVQTSLMLAAAAGLNPLAMGSAGMLGHFGMGGHGGMGGPMGMMGGGGMMGMQGMQGMPMSAAGAQSLIHGGQGLQGGMGGGGGMGVTSPNNHHAMLSGPGNGGVLPVPVEHQLQQMAGMHSYGMPYGNGGMHSNMAFFGGGGLN